MIARAEGFSPEASSDPDLHTGKRRSPVSYAMTVRDSAARQMAILLRAAMRPLEVPERRMTRYSGTDSPGNVDVVVDWERPFLLVADTGRTDTVCCAANSGWQAQRKFLLALLAASALIAGQYGRDYHAIC
ncbi:uncharacterized protein [Drosophila suzukii]|uniref:Uncharacterized protein n=1 Tax=Drosophila suzukii TaxID=28584 RepID=A0ABM4TM70_DROSZ